MEDIIDPTDTDIIEKGDVTMFGQKATDVVVLPGRHTILKRRDDNNSAHPELAHDFGLTNYVVIRDMQNGTKPYPMDAYVCRDPNCKQVSVQDPPGGIFTIQRKQRS
jgi:hypothetical protein